MMNGRNKYFMLMIIIFATSIWFAADSLWKTPSLPVMEFSFRQEKSQQQDFTKSTIMFQNQMYVSDYDEFCLEPLEPVRDKMIGRDRSGNRVYSIKGQDEYDYILFVDNSEMTIPVIFRKASSPSVSFTNMYFSKVKLFDKELPITKMLADDMIKSLKQIKGSKLSVKPQNVYGIQLILSQLDGIGYQVSVYEFQKKYYLAGKGFDKCVKTSNEFDLWFQSTLANSMN